MKFRDSSGTKYDVYSWPCELYSGCSSPVTPPKLRGGRTLISKMGVAEANEGVVAAVAQGRF